MATSMVAAVRAIRAAVAEATGMKHVYAASETDVNAIPQAPNEFPCVIIYPGPDTEPYLLQSNLEEHTYRVFVNVMDAGDVGAKAAELLPAVDAIKAVFVAPVGGNGGVKLGGSVVYCLFRGQSGFTGLEYGGIDYLGYSIELEVKEQASVVAAP